MPKITFFNLPDEKKQTLLQAAKTEFSRVPLADALISNIVKNAGVPRGSFYQYFEDKEDAFFYILNNLVGDIQFKFKGLLQKYEGDLFDALVDFFEMIIKEDENFHFMKNIFLNMTYQIDYTFSKSFGGSENKETYKQLASLINSEQLNVSSERELSQLMDIITAVTFRKFVEKFAKNIAVEDAVGNYQTAITLLKNGLSKPM